MASAQADMRRAYRDGAPGVLISGLVWMTAAAVALYGREQLSVLVLLIGGVFIYPLSVLLDKAMGHRGAHSANSPLGALAMAGTVWMLAGIVIAFAMQTQRLEWFYPVMLLVIGGRYLTFQTLYGLKIYWLLGALLCASGLLLGMQLAPVVVGAMAGAAIELIFALVLLLRARAQTANQLHV